MSKEALEKYDSYIKQAMNTWDKDLSKSFLDKAYGIAETLNILELLLNNIENENIKYD